MGEKTGIAWARSTFNPWIGCTEVSTEETGGGGCDACYARELDRRHRYGGAEHWGPSVPRYHTSKSYWRSPPAWHERAALELRTGRIEDHSDWHTPGFWPVFPSMCDPFDNEVSDEWHAELWKLISETPHLTWLLLTKRASNIKSMLPDYGRCPSNVRLGVSVVNNKEARRDIPRLAAIRARSRFVSYEPALAEVDWTGLLDGIHQVIVGGESRQGLRKPRPFVIGWARSTLRACRAAGVAFFMKQMGAFATNREGERHPFKDRAGADPAEWPEDLRVQEFPA